MSNYRLLVVCALLGALCSTLAAQVVPPPPPAAAGDTSIFRPLALPAPNRYRTGSGMPGAAYWQQRVDYVIQATLDTQANRLSGQERITYSNNSPDTLRYLWLQLDQNLFTDTSRGAALFGPAGWYGSGAAAGGFTIDTVRQPALPPATNRRRQAARALAWKAYGTMMRVELPQPLAPRHRYVFELVWSFPFQDGLSSRMGIERVDGATIYEVAQWYPRLAVYDDIRGWNTEPYLGQGEFYLEYGSFDVRLTLPAGMIVAATGVLRNPQTVLTPVERARLALARLSDTTVVVRSREELADSTSRPHNGRGTLTWHFTADSVRDFAWAAAPHFIWDAARANQGRTLVMSFYPPSADSLWSRATQFGRTALAFYSRRLVPYPYPVAINVNGIENGMEYPMIVFCHERTSAALLYSVTDHEFGHTWFPMMVGSNERLYPWMDEGFNTFINYYSQTRVFPELAARRSNPDNYLQSVRQGLSQPIMTPADRIRGTLRELAYNKPGLGLRILRETIAGPERFDPVFREYIRRWAFRHPAPADFFRTMEDGLGLDLSWFWRGWFYGTGVLDQAVDSVVVRTDSSGRVSSRIVLRNTGDLVMPVLLQLTPDAGAPRRLRLPVQVWYAGTRYSLTVPGAVRQVVVDPDAALPDVNRGNNAWSR